MKKNFNSYQDGAFKRSVLQNHEGGLWIGGDIFDRVVQCMKSGGHQVIGRQHRPVGVR